MSVRAKQREADARSARVSLARVRAVKQDSRPRGGVQSLARAFSIMEEIARNRDGIGLAELSKRVGLHNSTTFHLVKTMVSLGYVRQMKDSKRYRIGRPLFALAASALDEVEMVSLATPILEELSRETGESAHFSVRLGDAVVVLARTGGKGAFQLTDRAGAIRPAHCTALGKIMLAALASGSARAISRSRRPQGPYAEIDHLGRGAPPRDCRGATLWALLSMTGSLTRRFDVLRCRCAISAGRSSALSAFLGRSGDCR